MGEEANTNRDEEELTTKGEEIGNKKVDSAQTRTQDTSKVNILLRNVGDAPVLQHKEVLIRREEPLAKVIGFIQKQLGKAVRKEPGQPSVFVYLKSSFAPHPQEEVGVLADTFGVVDEGKSVRLVLHYALSPAWG